MSSSISTTDADVRAPGAPVAARRRRSWRWPGLRVDRFSGVYVAALLVLVFCIIEPSTFRTWTNVRVIAANEAITAIVTLGLIIALSAGMFDLSIGGTMG